MDSEASLRFPVIDFSKPDLKPGSPEWDSVKSQVRKALEEYGCFEALFNKVPLELRKSFFGAVEELFNLPVETKSLNQSEKPFHGYIGPNPIVPLFESIGIDRANIMEEVQRLTNILWPEGNQSISKTIHSYSEHLSELDQTIRRMILESFGLEKYMDEHMNSTNCLLRPIKYEGPQTPEAKVGLGAHKDKNIVTILSQLNPVDGLEVVTKDGEWIKVKPSPESFIVFIGESLYAWTNGRLYCPAHRVMMSGNEARYSAGLFSVPKGGCTIKAPEELVDSEHPLLFKPFNYGEFLNFFATEAGLKSKSPLKDYCGV